jgi:geranylgeranyl diphosphate synthase type II
VSSKQSLSEKRSSKIRIKKGRLKVSRDNSQQEKIKDLLRSKKETVDEALKRYLSSETGYPETLLESIKYSLFSGGKRLRPILVLASGEMVGGKEEALLPFACAVEMIHTYSLIHDDLPSMDDDDYRRGRLTNHKVYGEAVAILTGDALLTLAFKQMTEPGVLRNFKAGPVLRAVNEIAAAAGGGGMVGGQVADILSEGKPVNREDVDYIHEKKTGALIRASALIGALLAGGTEKELDAVRIYGEKIGLAFQIIDDILDVEGEEEILGKSVGKDQENSKATYPATYGLEESRKKAAQLIEEGARALDLFGERAFFLQGIAGFILKRRS